MHGNASERRKYLYCDDGITALLILRTVDGRFWSTCCYSTSIYLTGKRDTGNMCLWTLQHHHKMVTSHHITIQHMRATSCRKFFWHWLCELHYCSFYFYFDSSISSHLLFYNTRFREGQSNDAQQSNNINKGGEAASTFEHFPSGCAGQVNGGLLRVLLFIYSYLLHASKREKGGALRSYCNISMSRCGGSLFPSCLPTVAIFSNHRRRLFLGMFSCTHLGKEGRDSAVAAAAVSVCDTQSALLAGMKRRKMDSMGWDGMESGTFLSTCLERASSSK